jgi:hypothetical protein
MACDIGIGWGQAGALVVKECLAKILVQNTAPFQQTPAFDIDANPAVP